MTLSNSLFEQHILPAIRRRCHAAICDEDVDLPNDMHSRDISIGNKFDKSVFDKSKAYVVYGELRTLGLSTSADSRELLRGGTVAQGNYAVSVTVFADDVGSAYLLGDYLMNFFDRSARRRQDFRYFSLTNRYNTIHADSNSEVVIYEMKIQLQPRYEAN